MSHKSPVISDNLRNDIVKKVLTFSVDHEEYAVDILKVQEIKSVQHLMDITTLSDAPAAVRGIIRLHDVIVPIVDLRVFYGGNPLPIDEINVIIVLKISEKAVGIVVDAALEILELTTDQLKPPPAYYKSHYEDHIAGILSLTDRLVVLLDIEKLILSDRIGINAQTIASTVQAS